MPSKRRSKSKSFLVAISSKVWNSESAVNVLTLLPEVETTSGLQNHHRARLLVVKPFSQLFKTIKLRWYFFLVKFNKANNDFLNNGEKTEWSILTIERKRIDQIEKKYRKKHQFFFLPPLLFLGTGQSFTNQRQSAFVKSAHYSRQSCPVGKPRLVKRIASLEMKPAQNYFVDLQGTVQIALQQRSSALQIDLFYVTGQFTYLPTPHHKIFLASAFFLCLFAKPTKKSILRWSHSPFTSQWYTLSFPYIHHIYKAKITPTKTFSFAGSKN